MTSTNSKLGNLILQLHNRTNEAKEAFDQALAELELQKAENEKQYQEQLEQLKEERQKSGERATMERFIVSASPIVNLNVGGEKMSTSRATLTLVEGSLLATMFSGKWDDKLMKDTNGCIFLDYDPAVSRIKFFNFLSEIFVFCSVIQMSSKSTSYLVGSINETCFSFTGGI
jgi:hypothetical protein